MENMIENLQHLQSDEAPLASDQAQLQFELADYLPEIDYFLANDDYYPANFDQLDESDENESLMDMTSLISPPYPSARDLVESPEQAIIYARAWARDHRYDLHVAELRKLCINWQERRLGHHACI